MDEPTRVERWERQTEIPLLFLAIAFTVAYAWPILDRSLATDVRGFLTTLSWTTWGAFALDFAVRMALADDRGTYAWKHWYDVALIVLPFFRPLRVIRVLAVARILNRSAASSLVGRVAAYVAGVALMSIALGAVAVLDAERSASKASIHTIGDALWWATTTVTTVGYGDVYPVTTQGRLIAVALMLVGIAVVGTLTGAVAAWLIASVNQAAAMDTEL